MIFAQNNRSCCATVHDAAIDALHRRMDDCCELFHCHSLISTGNGNIAHEGCDSTESHHDNDQCEGQENTFVQMYLSQNEDISIPICLVFRQRIGLSSFGFDLIHGRK